MKFPRCEKTTSLCDKREYKEANWREIFLIQLHTLYCKECRTYSKKSEHFHRVLQDSALKHLSPDQKQVLKQQIEREMQHVNQPKS